MDPTGTSTVHHLRAAGVSVLVDATGDGLPRLLHWGADLGPLDLTALAATATAAVAAVPVGGIDHGTRLTVLPLPGDGWSGTPGLEGSADDDGAAAAPRFTLTDIELADDGEGGRLVVRAADTEADLGLVTTMELTVQGLLRVRHSLTRLAGATSPYRLASLLVLLPLAGSATELLDLTGRWVRERAPQRHALQQGSWRREGRHGRTGHDATLLMLAGTPGFGFGHGEVRGVHVAWSGDHVTMVEHLPTGRRVLGGGELLAPGEVALQPGDTYDTPWLTAAWSDVGLDGVSARVHDWLRARPTHPRTPRPITVNTWEAVYFQHDPDRLRALADAAADIGAERFVLDDGWFGARRDDRAGLGDWVVSTDVWPDGLAPIIDHVTGLGMEFGLWVEPEMVNTDSDLFRAHPDWVLGPSRALPPEWRHQQVLDLANPDAFAHVLGRLDALLGENDIASLKWDHNRDLIWAQHDRRPGVHAQTLALYRLLDELRRRHPGVEIETCSSGGGRLDLEILARTDRVWTSDCNDPLERQHLQRWTALLLPPELMGTHVGAATAHTTGRTHQLDFRCATALFGHAGLELDVTALSPGDRAQLRGWTALHRELRPLLHHGRVVRVDLPDDSALMHGVVSTDRLDALFSYAVVRSTPDAAPPPVPFPGLDPQRWYRVTVEQRAGGAWAAQQAPPSWTLTGVTLPGSVLGRVGLPMPLVMPEHAVLVRITAVDPVAPA